jgi:hypothetical protein
LDPQTIQDAMDTADKAQKKLAEVGKDVASIRADQTVDDGRILSLNGAADAQSSTNDKNWKDIMDMIQAEGDLFSKISKKLKDEELRKVCVQSCRIVPAFCYARACARDLCFCAAALLREYGCGKY